MKGCLPGSFWNRLALLLLLSLLISPALRAQTQLPFFDSFEAYQLGDLDSNGSGPNSGPGNGANPWFGSFPPNLEVVNAENGVQPHSGTNMIRGAQLSAFGYYNVSYRLNSSNAYTGNILLDWWFYDPLGSSPSSTNYAEAVGIGAFDAIPPDSDYGPNANAVPGFTFQLFSLGASSDTERGFDGTRYQAQILGAPGAYDSASGLGWYNTTTFRSVGWHHGRIAISQLNTNSVTTAGAFFIDDMTSPTLVQNVDYFSGYNAIQIESISTIGYFDDITFTVPTVPISILQVSVVDTNSIVTWPDGWILQSSTDLSQPAFVDVPGATSPYTNSLSAGNQFFRLRK